MIYNFIAENTNAGLNFDIDLDKDKRVYCFIGENGVGKTNLLENMAKSLIYTHSMFKQKQDDLKYSELYYKKGIMDEIESFSIELPIDVEINKIKIKNKWNVARFKDISQLNINFTFDKPLIFIGAKSRGYTKNIDINNIKILGDIPQRFLEGFNRSFNYINSESIEDVAIADWFNSRMIINPNFVIQNQNRQNEVLEVLELIEKLEENLNLIVKQSNGRKSLNFFFHDGKLFINNTPIDKLSTGFVSIIKIFQEIIAGYGGWAGISGETNIREMKGVVFIDEIESHLHPKWQYKIIPLLKEFFPNTTFYIATHSPLIISTTEEGEAYELVKDSQNEKNITSKRLGNPREWYLADVFSQAFHIPLINKTLKEYEAKNENSELSLDDKLLKFSNLVKDYIATDNLDFKNEAKELYSDIKNQLPESDPRVKNLKVLKGLINETD